MSIFKYSNSTIGSLTTGNSKHKFALQQSLMAYKKNALYTFIPKNGCTSLRYSIAADNGCIKGPEDFLWIHANNATFQATLKDAILADFTFTVLRCPFRRIASVYLDKFVGLKPEAWRFCNKINREIEPSDLTFDNFLKKLKDKSLLNLDIHWVPQSNFMLFEEYTNYYAMEKFDEVCLDLDLKIGLKIVDTRKISKHGIDGFKLVTDRNYSNISALDILRMKKEGLCPSPTALFNDELRDLVTKIYEDDFKLYKEKISSSNFLFD
jgi:hypothetical protein